jgi:hypothetical protein
VADAQDELRRLIAHALQFDLQSRQLALLFDQELERVWREWGRLIERILRERGTLHIASGSLQLRAGQVLGLRNALRDALADAGYDAAALAGVQEATVRWMNLTGVPIQSTATTVSALQQLAARNLLVEGDSAAITLWRAMAQAVLSPRARPVPAIVDDLSKSLDATQANARTLFDTQMTIFGRQVESSATEDLGAEQPFMYSGPVDLKTRDFCLARVGKVFTRKDIEAMDNGQIPNVMLTGGGFNCRHVWMAVESRALRGLAGTGQRADGFDEDIARVKRRQEERREAAQRKKAS